MGERRAPRERALLERVLAEADAFLGGLDDRPVRPEADVDAVAAALGGPLPEHPEHPEAVLERLVAGASPGLVVTPSPRFFGWVIGGVVPAALAADWLTSLWDQNAGLLVSSPAGAAAERVASAWLLDLLGLPAGAGVGYVTGGTMANFTCLAAARDEVLHRVGWDVTADGLQGAPTVSVVVGEERHDTIDVALRYLGLGEARSHRVAVDDQGRLRADALAETLAALPAGPRIVCLQAGNVHSGAFDPFADAVALAHDAGAWVHVDGAFGLWAAASPTRRDLLAGYAEADSWATDAHKTLNVPYDSGLAVVADPSALHRAMGVHGAYLIQDERADPMEAVPEFSRRARGFTVWAALASLGRSGVAGLVDGLCARARQFADGLASVPGARVLNDVGWTQVCVAFDDDAETREVARRLLADGTAWMTTSRWRDRVVLRISVSNWRTTPADVERSLEALRRAVAGARAAAPAG